jgi:hypothetical protein
MDLLPHQLRMEKLSEWQRRLIFLGTVAVIHLVRRQRILVMQKPQS